MYRNFVANAIKRIFVLRGFLHPQQTLDEPIGLLQALVLPLIYPRLHCCVEAGTLVPVKHSKKEVG